MFNDLKEIKEKIVIDYNFSNYKVISTINKEFIVDLTSPIQLMKVGSIY